MRKKSLLILSVCMMALVVASFLVWNLLYPPHHYERNIARNFDNPEEENALITAEFINYSAITSFERFAGSNDPEDYIHSGAYLDYTYANFIDSQVINYYQTRYMTTSREKETLKQ